MAAAEAAMNGLPPQCPGPHGGNVPSQPQRGIGNAAPQDPGAPPQPAFTRPVFYLPTHPPPPLLHYQWPMPFSYNPFSGFPGMGYGMVMPPFPPPPFMEAPPYILPHSHMQPVDYRRYSSAPGGPHQNPIPARRGPTPAAAASAAFSVRATVSTEVQTEPLQRAEGGYVEACTDSGHGTASSSPSSSNSSSQKRSSAGNCTSANATSSQDDQLCTGSAVKRTAADLHNAGKNAVVPSFLKASQEMQTTKGGGIKEPPIICAFQSSHFHMWSESSPDSMIPVCSSSQTEDEVMKERRISIPDILMLQMAEKALPQNDHQVPDLETEEQHEKSVQSLSESRNGNVSVDDDEGTSGSDGKETHGIPGPHTTLLEKLSESNKEDPEELGGSVRCRLTYRDEVQNSTQNPPEHEQEKSNLHDDTTEMASCYVSSSSFQMRRKMNESVWSVESLEPFVPNREWLLQNGFFEDEVIIETEEADDGTENLNSDLFVGQKESGPAQRCSSSNAGPVLDGRPVFSTPGERQGSPKKQRMESETVPETSEAERGLNTPEKSTLTPPKVPQSKTVATLTENLEEEEVSKEHPKQGVSCVTEQKEQIPGSPEEGEQQKVFLLSSAAQKMLASVRLSLQTGDVAEDKGLGALSQPRREELSVPAAAPKLADVSPSKGPSVDTGIQCSDLCSCDRLKNCKGPNQVHLPKIPDMRKANYEMVEQSCMDGRQPKNSKRGNSGRNRNQDRYNIQHEVHGYGGKSGRFKGGTARNPHY